MIRSPALLALALPLLAAAKPASLAGAQPPLNCIPINQIRETRVLDDRHIDFVMSGRRVWRATLPAACPQLGAEKRFAYETSLSQLCSADIITVLLQYGGPGLQRGASCGLGAFTAVAPAR